jgi:hypothetical protein
MMGDDYLFWRISEGGVSFETAMPAWNSTLDENTRWDVINYIKALGTGKVTPGSGAGGATFDQNVQATRQAETLAQAVAQGVITQAEAETFNTVHTALEQYRIAHPDTMNLGNDATEHEAAILAVLVKAQTINQSQADAFMDIHDRLGASGLMP